MVFHKPGTPLTLEEIPTPKPLENEVLVRVRACGVCRTDLHIVDGDLPEPALPLVLGHQVVGEIIECGKNAKKFKRGDRIGIPWLGGTCHHCYYCDHDQENLCDKPVFTGYQKNGGYAEYTTANEDYCFLLDNDYSDIEVAPLLCAGLIGYRSYRMAGGGKRIGFYGFGAAAHIQAQLAVHEGKELYAFTRPGDTATQDFALTLGAAWAGGSDQAPPAELDSAILFAPVGELVPVALKALRKGGIVVCAGIHMSDIPSFPYEILWGERKLQSVANLTRQDGHEFLALAPQVPIRVESRVFPLEEANQAIDAIRKGKSHGSVVLTLNS